MEGMTRPLAGIRVLDLSRLLPGPFATLCLQGLGATVVKIEDPGVGDYLRVTPPFLVRDGVEVGAWFAAVNRGKRSVALDLRQQVGRDALLALCADADVLVESFRPGVLARLGLPIEMLVDRFPRLVVASLTGWGQSGPMAPLPGHDNGFMALAGMLALTEPRLPAVQWGDLAAGGLTAALRIVAALYGRDRPDAVRMLDVAMVDGLVGLNVLALACHAAGEPPSTLLTGGIPSYGIYRCLDGWIALGALEPQFLGVLSAATDVSAAALTTFFAGGTRAEWADRFGAACVVPVLTPGEVERHPQIQARSLFADGLPHPPTGPVEGAVPTLGEHTAAELRRVGYQES